MGFEVSRLRSTERRSPPKAQKRMEVIKSHDFDGGISSGPWTHCVWTSQDDRNGAGSRPGSGARERGGWPSSAIGTGDGPIQARARMLAESDFSASKSTRLMPASVALRRTIEKHLRASNFLLAGGQSQNRWGGGWGVWANFSGVYNPFNGCESRVVPQFEFLRGFSSRPFAVKVF